jgi:threonyl-tRNA synthetase
MIITFPDKSKKNFKRGVTSLEVAESIGSRLANDAIAAKVEGVLVDLSRKISKDSKLEILTGSSIVGVEVLRHSCAHLLAHAVKRLFPKALPTIGPVIENGFYYDFDASPFSEVDLEKIELEMEKIVKEKILVERFEVSKNDAMKLFGKNKYKKELINESKGKISYYRQGDFKDLCTGPHIVNTARLKAFKITKSSGSYWRGDSKNKQLQRIYGVCFADKKDLKLHLKMLEEALKRDHKLLAEGKLYMISDLVGKGLPIWLPKGEIVKKVIEDYALEMEEKAGFQRVSTPHIAKEELFLASGHLPHYEADMFPKMKMDDGTYYLKAMNCPLHHIIFSHGVRSYRELPLRIAEYGTVYRNEMSGVLSGLLRVRMLSMNDAHIYCSKDQIGSEVKSVISMIEEYYKTFGFKNYYFRLSLWDPKNKEKYISEPANWKYAEAQLRKVLKELKVNFEEVEDEAAFYGPKIDIQFKTVTGREETLSTVQLDFAAKKRFGLKFVDKDGKVNNDVFVIHRAPLSVHERFIAFLIEHYGGNFPLWLAPVQVRILPISDKVKSYVDSLKKELPFRVEVDSRAESINKKVRNAQLEKIPVMVIIGEKEMAGNTVSVRTLDGNVKYGIKKSVFVKKISDLISSKSRQVSFK